MYNIKTLPVYFADHLKEAAEKEGVKIAKGTTKLICMLSNDAVIGFSSMKLGKHKASLNGLFIEPNHRGQGLGSELVRTRLILLRGMGYKTIESRWDILSVNIHKDQGGIVSVHPKTGVAKIVFKQLKNEQNRTA